MTRAFRLAVLYTVSSGLLCTAPATAGPADSAWPGPFRSVVARSIYERFLAGHLRMSSPGPEAPAAGVFVRPAALSLSALEVSADTAAGRFAQVEPVIGRFDDGRHVVFWRDQSSGDFELFGRRFDRALAPIAAVFPLFADGLARRPEEPAGASDGARMMLTWVDRASGHTFAALVDTSAQLKASFPLDETPQAQFVGAPAVAARLERGFIAAWEEFRSGFHIFAQSLDSVGAKVGFNINVDGGADTILHLSPGAAGDTANGFVIVWSAGNTSRSDVYARLFDAAGTPLSSAIAVSSPLGTESYLLPAAVYVPAADEYWISYIQTDSPVDSTVLFLRRLSRAGTFVGPATALSAGPYPWSPEFARVGDHVALFTERFDNAAELRSLSLDSAAAIVDSTTVINASAFYDRLALSATEAGDTIAVVWQDRRSGGNDIRGRLRDTTGNISPDALLSTESAGGQQTAVALAGRSGGGIRLYMQDSQKDDGDITMAGIREDGTVDERLLINDDGTLAEQYEPAAASDSAGRGLVVWTDLRTDWTGPARHVAGRFVAAAGGFLGPAFIVPQNTSATSQAQPDVAMAQGGEVAVVWIDDRSGTGRAYMRLFAPDRSPLTSDIAINDGGQTGVVVAEERAPKVSMDSARNIWAAMCVLDVLTDSFFVFAQSFDPAGTPRGATLDLSPAGRTATPLAFDLVARPDGTALLVWAEPALPQAGVWAGTFDTLGTPLATAFRISDSAISAFEPVAFADLQGLWAASWVQPNGLSRDVLWRRYDATDSPVDTVLRISPGTPARQRQSPALFARGIYLYGAWHDNQDPGDGFDVRVSSEVYAASAVRDDDVLRPDDFVLGANYPNPFNAETVIEYALKEPAFVRLVVFDLLGRHVRTLGASRLSPGHYRTRWDGKDAGGKAVASGVYFYQMMAGAEAETRKMLLLR